jgi:adenylate kinase family enzyme
MNLKEIAAELAALTVIKDAVTEATNTLRELAKITLISKDASFVVLDEKALIAWITDNFPTEIEPKVRDSFRKKFTETLAITAENQIFSTMTGEVLAFMGLDYKAPYVSTRFSPDGREVVLEAIRNHRVTTLPWLNFYVESQKLKEIE